MIRERPILFSGPMVRALLDGRKTQTRRVVKPQPSDYTPETVAPQRLQGQPPKHPRPYFDAYNGGPHWCWWDEYDRQGADWIKCPYGVPGDQLWVRETWCEADTPSGYDYAARFTQDTRGWGWRPSIHMPRKASRLTLTITDVRVERLQDISEADAIAEGVQRVGGGALRWENWSGVEGQSGASPKAAFALLWNHINGKGAWDANPWVWALTFQVEERQP